MKWLAIALALQGGNFVSKQQTPLAARSHQKTGRLVCVQGTLGVCESAVHFEAPSEFSSWGTVGAAALSLRELAPFVQFR